MGAFLDIVQAGLSVMMLPLSLFGFTITLWQVFLFSAVAYAVLRVVFGMFL